MYAVRINETKITWGNASILDLFGLGGEKNENMTKKPFFCGSPQS